MTEASAYVCKLIQHQGYSEMFTITIKNDIINSLLGKSWYTNLDTSILTSKDFLVAHIDMTAAQCSESSMNGKELFNAPHAFKNYKNDFLNKQRDFWYSAEFLKLNHDHANPIEGKIQRVLWKFNTRLLQKQQ